MAKHIEYLNHYILSISKLAVFINLSEIVSLLLSQLIWGQLLGQRPNFS